MAIPLWRYGICYYPAPKVANTSVKHAMYWLKEGRSFEAAKIPGGGFKHIHKVYKTPLFDEVDNASYENLLKFTIVRDPIDRLVSVWRNRVMHHRELSVDRLKKVNNTEGLVASPDLNTFVENIEGYRMISPSIRTHSNPLVDFLGTSPDFFHLIFDIRNLSNLQKFLSLASGKEVQIPHEQTGGPPANRSNLKPENIDKIKIFYEKDYRIYGRFFSTKSAGVKKSYNS